MKKMFRLGATVMAFGAGLMMAAGVANAANTAAMQNMPADQMAKISSWNGVGSVVPSVLPLSDVDYKGVVTTFKSIYPDAQITSISYDGKHNPTYEVEGYAGGQKIEMHIRETGEILGTEVKPMKHGNKEGHMKKHGSMMYGQAMKGMHGMSKAFDVNDIIMPEVAETKAQEKVGGTFEAMDWSVEKDHGRLVYELDMIDGSGKEAEVKVDAMTGEIINVKMKTSKY